MKIKEGVIYNKNEEFIGYTMLGEVNDSLLPNVSTPSIATYSSLLWILVCLKVASSFCKLSSKRIMWYSHIVSQYYNRGNISIGKAGIQSHSNCQFYFQLSYAVHLIVERVSEVQKQMGP